MITCDHHDADARAPASYDGIRHLTVRRVHEGYETQKRQISFDRIRFNALGLISHFSGGHGEDPVGLFRKEPALTKDSGTLLVGHGDHLPVHL